MQIEYFPNKKTKHGLSYSREYQIWEMIVQRTTNPKNTHYSYYGGRGIKISKKWLRGEGFVNFINHIGFAPTQKHTVDRINNSKGYEPDNVRWVTMEEQSKNKRNTNWLTYQNKKLCLADMARQYGLYPQALRSRLKKGWSLKESLTIPLGTRQFRRQTND